MIAVRRCQIGQQLRIVHRLRALPLAWVSGALSLERLCSQLPCQEHGGSPWTGHGGHWGRVFNLVLYNCF